MKKLYFLPFFLLLSCKPQRDNPYDPKSPEYIGKGTVKGRVTDMVGVPLCGAVVSTMPLELTTKTDSNGLFVLNPEPGTWKLVANMTGYAPETTEVHITVDSTKEAIFLLNGMPMVQSAHVISEHEGRGWPAPSIYWAQVLGEVYDPDGIQDIDSVWVTVELDTSVLKRHLSYQNGIYGTIIYADSCPNRNLESLIGRSFVMYAVDKKGAMGISANFYLSRIIYSLPYVIRPIYGDTLNQGEPIDFVWNGIEVSYPIVYRLIIRSWPGLDTILTKSGILDTTTTIDSLLQAEYYWRVEGTDDLGNISRSSATTFVVK